ncbi:MAG: uridine kinase [Nitrososphaerales archaeon]
MVLIGGGSGCGKSTLAAKLLAALPEGAANVIQLDSYYHDLSHLPIEERDAVNFDSPGALDWRSLKHDVNQLLEGKSVNIPTYSHLTHTRASLPRVITPTRIIILEGILALYDSDLNSESKTKIYLDLGSDIRFIRRLDRDVRERGRSIDSVVNQYLSTVRPMHERFVEPTRRNADFIIQIEEPQEVASMIAKIREL